MVSKLNDSMHISEEYMDILEIYEPLANKDTEVMIRLAGFYEFGYYNEIQVDFQKALSLYKRAASYGNAKARMMVKNLNSLGISVKFDAQEDAGIYRFLRKWDVIHSEEEYVELRDNRIKGSKISVIGVLNTTEIGTNLFGIVYGKKGLEIQAPVVTIFPYKREKHIVIYIDETAAGFKLNQYGRVLLLTGLDPEGREYMQGKFNVLCCEEGES